MKQLLVVIELLGFCVWNDPASSTLSFLRVCFTFFSKSSKFGFWGFFSSFHQVFLCLWTLGNQSRRCIARVAAVSPRSGAEGPWAAAPLPGSCIRALRLAPAGAVPAPWDRARKGSALQTLCPPPAVTL